MLFSAHKELEGQILRLGPAPADLQANYVLKPYASCTIPACNLSSSHSFDLIKKTPQSFLNLEL